MEVNLINFIMELQIKVIRNHKPVEGLTAMVVDGPGSWPEIAAISNSKGEFSFQVERDGVYKVHLFSDDNVKTILVKSGEQLIIDLD